jgi:hypothetical protein
LGACAPRPHLNTVSAGSLAARLANDRCQSLYGQRPFHAEDFEALSRDGRWHWGTEDGQEKIDGFEVEVSFARDGRADSVMVRIPPE